MRYLSLCSGIEAASVAWDPLGWTPVAFSEVDPFACSVLRERFPGVPNLGDMTRFEEWDVAEGAVDVVVGGTPCQSFSIAGNRGGIEDERGGLAIVYCRILEKLRPRWFLWENVPGVLSSGRGRDFGAIIRKMDELGYGMAWRVLDAQYFGVPQRRRRVFVVGCADGWERAAKVLFEPGCLRRDSEKSRKARKTVATLTATGVGTCGADDNQGQAGHLISHTLRGEGFDASEDGTGRGTPLVVASTGDISHCLNAGGMGRQDYETETMVVAFAQNQRDEVRTVDVVGALSAQPGMKQQTFMSLKQGVRRLLPEECELLQGFPAGWTAVPHGRGGKIAADGNRYKAVGNSMAVPVIRWIGERIEQCK